MATRAVFAVWNTETSSLRAMTVNCDGCVPYVQKRLEKYIYEKDIVTLIETGSRYSLDIMDEKIWTSETKKKVFEFNSLEKLERFAFGMRESDADATYLYLAVGMQDGSYKWRYKSASSPFVWLAKDMFILTTKDKNGKFWMGGSLPSLNSVVSHIACQEVDFTEKNRAVAQDIAINAMLKGGLPIEYEGVESYSLGSEVYDLVPENQGDIQVSAIEMPYMVSNGLPKYEKDTKRLLLHLKIK